RGLLESAREDAGNLSGWLAANRRQILAGCRRLFLVRGSFRRHAESRRPVGEPGRSRTRLDGTPRGPRVRRRWPRGRRRTRQAGGLCRVARYGGGFGGAGRGASTLRAREAGRLQAAALGR